MENSGTIEVQTNANSPLFAPMGCFDAWPTGGQSDPKLWASVALMGDPKTKEESGEEINWANMALPAMEPSSAHFGGPEYMETSKLREGSLAYLHDRAAVIDPRYTQLSNPPPRILPYKNRKSALYNWPRSVAN
jgi:hypothetical protein